MNAPVFMLEKPNADFNMVCNALLRDKSISLRAKGLYALMFSKPCGWVFHEAALLNESTEGRDALRAAMKELLAAKWIEKRQPRDGGQFRGSIFRMHLTVDWKSGDGLTGDGKSTTNKTDNIKTDKPIPPTPKGEPDGFKEFWDAYPNKAKKPKAMAIWARLKADHADVMAGLLRWKASEQWAKDKGKYIPHPTSWLNAEGWNDVVPGQSAPLSAEALEASRRKTEEAGKATDAMWERLKADRRRQLGLSE